MQAIPNLHRLAALKMLEDIRTLRDILTAEMAGLCNLPAEDRATIWGDIAGCLGIFGMRDSAFRQSRRRDRALRCHLDALRRTRLLRQTSQNSEDVLAHRDAKTKSADAIFGGPGNINIRFLMGTLIGGIDKIDANMNDPKYTESNNLIYSLFDHAEASLLSVATDAVEDVHLELDLHPSDDRANAAAQRRPQPKDLRQPADPAGRSPRHLRCHRCPRLLRQQGGVQPSLPRRSRDQRPSPQDGSVRVLAQRPRAWARGAAEAATIGKDGTGGRLPTPRPVRE